MLYKLIIVEDVETIRQGLAEYVDWEEVGFKVIGTFEDGQEAIEFIGENEVDVILTDIKMSFVSGLELAEYIREESLDIKVVIISSYKEFKYAKKAIECNVVDYLLKPIKMNRVKEVFSKIRSQFLKKEEEKKQLRTLLPIIRKQFLLDLLVGAVDNIKEIEEKLKLLNINVNPMECYCSIESIKMDKQEQKIDKEDFNRILTNYFLGKKNNINYFPVRHLPDGVQIFTLSDFYQDEDKYSLAKREYIEQSLQELSSLFGLELRADTEKSYENMCEMLNYESEIDIFGEENIFDKNNYDVLEEEKKLFLSYLNAGNFEALDEILNKAINELKSMDINIIKNFVIEFFSLLANKLMDDMGVNLHKISGSKFNYNELLKMNNIREIKHWSRSIFEDIINNTVEIKKNNQRNLILQAKNYIKENYNKDLSLEAVADQVYLSPGYFSRLFKKETGSNFTDYLIKIRIKKAIDLLKNSEYKIYQVSEMIGYNSSKYFSRLFKQHTGYSPSEYKEHAINESDE